MEVKRTGMSGWSNNHFKVDDETLKRTKMAEHSVRNMSEMIMWYRRIEMKLSLKSQMVVFPQEHAAHGSSNRQVHSLVPMVRGLSPGMLRHLRNVDTERRCRRLGSRKGSHEAGSL